MKNILEVLQQKEAEYQKLGKEIEALRIAARLLADDPDVPADGNPKPAMTLSVSQRPVPPVTMRDHTDGVGGQNVSSLRQFP